LGEDCSHNIAENAKLKKVAQFYPCFVHQFDLFLPQVIDYPETFEAVAHELRQVVVKVFIDEFEVLLDVRPKLLHIIENFPESLLDEGE